MWVWLSIKLKHSRVALSVGKHIHTCRIEMSSEFQSNAWVARHKSPKRVCVLYADWIFNLDASSAEGLVYVCTPSSFTQRETSTAILPKWVKFRRMARHWSLFSQRYQFAAPFNNWNCDELHIKLNHDFFSLSHSAEFRSMIFFGSQKIKRQKFVVRIWNSNRLQISHVKTR